VNLLSVPGTPTAPQALQPQPGDVEVLSSGRS